MKNLFVLLTLIAGSFRSPDPYSEAAIVRSLGGEMQGLEGGRLQRPRVWGTWRRGVPPSTTVFV